MATRATFCLLTLLVGLVAVAAWAQRPAPADATQAQTQPSTEQAGGPAGLKTADGVAACPAETASSALPDGVHRPGKGVVPPRATRTPEAEFSDEARKYVKKHHIKGFRAVSILSLTVDEQGMPRDICVKTAAGYGLDRKAYEAVEQYRFDPATLHGEPIPERVMVEVNFNLF
jgi:protein TonB